MCEMCGKEVPDVNTVKIEGAVLKLCPTCSRFGTVIEPSPIVVLTEKGQPAPISATRLATHQKKREERDVFTELPQRELDPDWPKKIRMARESLGLTQEAFGNLLNEKSSVVHKLEGGEIQPADALVHKIEKTLKIRLTLPPGSADS
jgi:putative transcription factor